MKRAILFLSFLTAMSFLPSLVLADYGYFTMPIDPSSLSYSGSNTGINSWFDHTDPRGLSDISSTMTRSTGVQYFGAAAALATSTLNPTSTCTDFNGAAGCYNGHSGIDFAVASGTQVFAAASGTIQQAQWEDPGNTNLGFGLFVRISHPQYGLSTLYGHLSATTTGAFAGDDVARNQLIGYSGGTGAALGHSHLHFQVYAANLDVNTSTGEHLASSVDPFGWTGGGSDPWPNDTPFGYMWASQAATSSVYNYVTSSYTMSASTTWLADQIYIIQGSLTISSGVTLTIPKGTVVKFTSGGDLDVHGDLVVNGTADDPVYFTSLKDDAVGGDANDDATSTSPALGDWGYVSLDSGSTATISHATFRYGGAANNPIFADLYLNGGTLSATSTIFASSSYYGFEMAGGTATINTSIFLNNNQYGFFSNYNNTGSLTITNSAFINNGSGSGTGAGYVDYSGGQVFTASGNTASGNSINGYTVGQLGGSPTWNDDLPYYTSNFITSPSGQILTVNAGGILKFGSTGAQLVVNGQLRVNGTSTEPAFFTSYKDDSVGGDTTNDGTGTSPAGGDWYNIQFGSGSSSTINYAVIRYGGYYMFPSSANIYMAGGTINAWHVTIASSSAGSYDIQMANGTIVIASSTLQGDGTTASVMTNNTNTTSSATATDNYWGASSGPYNAVSNSGGAGAGVGDYISFNPWLTSAP